MNVEGLNFDAEALNDEFNSKINELLEWMKHIHPYQLLSNALNYYKMLHIVSSNGNEFYDEDVVLKFTYEFLQMMYSLINEEEISIEEYSDSMFNSIVKLVEEIYILLSKYVLLITLDKNIDIPDEQREYIFSDFNSMIVTGKRYDIFENEHHVEVLSPLSKYFRETYGFEIEEVYNGINLLKYKFVFGLNDAHDQMAKVVDSLSCDADGNILECTSSQISEGRNATFEIFGLELHNVEKVCGWKKEFINIFSLSLGSNRSLLQNLSVNNIIDLYSQINSKPIIKLANDYYCLNPQRLFDNIDRIIIKDLYRKNVKIKQELITNVSDNCEYVTAKMFKKILPKCTIYQKNYYKISTGFAENDLLIEYDKNLIIVEVKSGAFTPDVAINNINSHVKSLMDLVEKGAVQANNLFEKLKEEQSLKLYEKNCSNSIVKKEVIYSNYNKIYKIIITLESFNEIESRIEKVKLINVNKDTIVICLDDLRVYSDYFKNEPMTFLHYLNQRVKATRNNTLYLNDELDHLGLYIKHNDYVMYTNKMAKENKDFKIFYFCDSRSLIDKYYNDQYFKGIIGIKPKQEISYNLKSVIDFCNNNFVQNSSIFICDMLDLCEEAQTQTMDKYINDLYQTNIVYNRNKMLYLDIKNFYMITCVKETDILNSIELDERIYANMLIHQVEICYAVFIYYNLNKKVKNIIIKEYLYSNVSDVNRVVQLAKKIEMERPKKPVRKNQIGRNDICPCGSGKKYKYCCGIKKNK